MRLSTAFLSSLHFSHPLFVPPHLSPAAQHKKNMPALTLSRAPLCVRSAAPAARAVRCGALAAPTRALPRLAKVARCVLIFFCARADARRLLARAHWPPTGLHSWAGSDQDAHKRALYLRARALPGLSRGSAPGGGRGRLKGCPVFGLSTHAAC